MTLEEAAELWNKSTDSLRQACISRQGRPPRFNTVEKNLARYPCGDGTGVWTFGRQKYGKKMM